MLRHSVPRGRRRGGRLPPARREKSARGAAVLAMISWGQGLDTSAAAAAGEGDAPAAAAAPGAAAAGEAAPPPGPAAATPADDEESILASLGVRASDSRSEAKKVLGDMGAGAGANPPSEGTTQMSSSDLIAGEMDVLPDPGARYFGVELPGDSQALSVQEETWTAVKLQIEDARRKVQRKLARESDPRLRNVLLRDTLSLDLQHNIVQQLLQGNPPGPSAEVRPAASAAASAAPVEATAPAEATGGDGGDGGDGGAPMPDRPTNMMREIRAERLRHLLHLKETGGLKVRRRQRIAVKGNALLRELNARPSADAKRAAQLKAEAPLPRKLGGARAKAAKRPRLGARGGSGGAALAGAARERQQGAESAAPRGGRSVRCPLCQARVQLGDGEDADAELAKHMGECQSTRRTSRARKRPSRYEVVALDSSEDDEKAAPAVPAALARVKRDPVFTAEDSDSEEEEGEVREPRRAVAVKAEAGGGAGASEDSGDAAEEDGDEAFVEEGLDGDSESDEDADGSGFVPEADALVDHGDYQGHEDGALDSDGAAAPLSLMPKVCGSLADDGFAHDFHYRMRRQRDAEDADWASGELEDPFRSVGSAEDPLTAARLSDGLIVPLDLVRRLHAYQIEGLNWMWGLHGQGAGGIIGDEMGLGKTAQVVAFLRCFAELGHEQRMRSEARRRRYARYGAEAFRGEMRALPGRRSSSSRSLRCALVVCPATMLSHWRREFWAWAPELRVAILHRASESFAQLKTPAEVERHVRSLLKWAFENEEDAAHFAADSDDGAEHHRFDVSSPGRRCVVCVCSYEALRKWRDVLLPLPWGYAVLDEGQRIRNPHAEITAICKQFRTPHRLLLTGTPIQNDLRELWSLLDFAFPGRLGTLPSFEFEFCEPIRRGGYANASREQALLAYRCAVVLRNLVAPYLLRRTKDQCVASNHLALPKKTEQVLFCRLTARQRELYEEYLRSEEAQEAMAGLRNCFRALGVLRKICNHPDLVCPPEDVVDGYERSGDRSGFGAEERSGKLLVLRRLLPLWKARGHRCLIFTQTRQALNVIERCVARLGLRYLRLDGETSVGQRQAMVDHFNNNRAGPQAAFAMICTTRTGGVGVNLLGADRVVIYDPDWNPQVDAQARERSWRIGQDREVTIYRLVCAGTLEEKIYHRQIFKTAISDRVLRDPRQKRLFSRSELKDLFTLRAEDADDDGNAVATDTGMLETDAIVEVPKPPRRRQHPQEEPKAEAPRRRAQATQRAARDRVADGMRRRSGGGSGGGGRRWWEGGASGAPSDEEGEVAEEEAEEASARGNEEILSALLDVGLKPGEDAGRQRLPALSGVVSHDLMEITGEGRDSNRRRRSLKDRQARRNSAVYDANRRASGDLPTGSATFDAAALEAQTDAAARRARELAAKAAQSLLRSSMQVAAHRRAMGNAYAPTWTGVIGDAGASSAAAAPIFGAVNRFGAAQGGDAASGGVVSGIGEQVAALPPSSADLLARLSGRQGAEAEAAEPSAEEEGMALARKLQARLAGAGRAGVPSSALLSEFAPEDSQASHYVYLFRDLLRKMAKCVNGRWKLRAKFAPSATSG